MTTTFNTNFSRRGFLKVGMIGAGAVAAPALISGCGGGAGVASPDGKLVLWHNYTQEARVQFMDKAARAFEKQNPGTTVQIEVVPAAQFPNKWPAAQQAGTLPDVTTILPENAVTMQLAGALNPMDDVLAGLGGESAFIPGLIEKVFRYKGATLALPHYVHNRLLIFRKDIIEASSVQIPEKPNWQQALDAARAAQKPPQSYGWILKLAKSDTGGAYLMHLLTQGVGGNLIDPEGKSLLTSPEVRQAGDYLLELASTVSAPGQTGYAIGDGFTLMSTGKTVMSEDTAALIGNTTIKDADLGGKLTSSFFPRESKPAHLIGTFGFALPKGRNPDLAKKFVQFMYSEAMYTPFLQSIPLFMFPALQAANTEAFYQQPTIAKHRVTAEQTLTGVAEGVAPGFADGPNPYAGPTFASHVIEEALQSMLLNKVAPKDAWASADNRLQTILDDVRSRVGKS